MKLLINSDLTSGLWCQQDALSQCLEQGHFSSLEELNELIERHSATGLSAFIEGGLVTMLSVEMPIKQPRQIVKALPFALEEQLANDISENHLTYLGKENGLAYAAVIKKIHMERLLSTIPLQVLSPLALSLPLNSGEWTVYINKQNATVRTDSSQGFACSIDQLALYLEHSKVTLTEEISLNILAIKGENHDLLVAQLESAGFKVSLTKYASAWEFLTTSDKRTSVNLLSGEYKPLPIKQSKKPSMLRPIYGLAASIFLLGVMINVWEGKTDHALASEVKGASVAYYKALFPGQRMPKLTRKVKDKFSAGSSVSTTGFTSGLGLIGQTLKTNTQFASIELKSIRFNEKRGGFELDLTASSIAQLESYKSKLGEKGFTVEIRSATNEASKVKGLLKVSHNG